MCGLSAVEFVVIVVVAIMVLDPAKMPELLAQAGKMAREVKRLRADLGNLGQEIQRSSAVADLKKAVTDDPDLRRARERAKDVEAEIDALRARLKAAADSSASPAAPPARVTSRAAGGPPTAEDLEALRAAGGDQLDDATDRASQAVVGGALAVKEAPDPPASPAGGVEADPRRDTAASPRDAAATGSA